MDGELTKKGIEAWIKKSKDFLYIIFEDKTDNTIFPPTNKHIPKIKERDGVYGDFLYCCNRPEGKNGLWGYELILTYDDLEEIEKLILIHNKKIFKQEYNSVDRKEWQMAEYLLNGKVSISLKCANQHSFDSIGYTKYGAILNEYTMCPICDKKGAVMEVRPR